jgi:hypothetical protein
MKHPYLTARAGSRNLYFRRKFPVELHPVLQRSELWVSLETPDRKVAVARLPKAAACYDAFVISARKALPASTPSAVQSEDWQPGRHAVCHSRPSWRRWRNSPSPG